MTAAAPQLHRGLLSMLWLVIVLAPVYVLVKGSLQTQADYNASGPLSLPKNLTTANYKLVFQQASCASS